MQSAIAISSQTTDEPHSPESINAPEPLEFFLKDSVHSDNLALLERDHHRWRLLGWWERIRLQGYVNSLARQLRRGKYNDKLLKLERLRTEIRAAKAIYASDVSDDEKQRVRRQIIDIARRARPLITSLQELKSTYETYRHYADWLDYERKHRRELQLEAEREKRIRKEMRRESKWLQQLLEDVFRKTAGCHHIYSDGEKEITKIPRFERAVITADAHWYYLAASRKTIFGWKWLLPYKVTITRLTDEEVIANMRAATKRQVDAIWSESGQLMFRVSRLDSPDALPKEVRWRDAMKFFPESKREKLPYTIGVAENRKFQWFDLASDPHILVAGKSQSGKSNLVNGIIATLVSTLSPSELRLVLIDQKGGIEFTHWHELPHLLGDVVKTIEAVEPALTRLVAIMRSRMALLEKAKKKDIASYNVSVDVEHRLARVLVVIDELNTIVGLGKLTEDIHNLIMLLVSQGRAVGLHVIASTQHPEVKVIPGRIKTNMSMRLSGAMPTISASQIVLDSPEAARIPNIPGRFVAVIGLQTLIVQVPRIFDEDIAGVVSSSKRLYPDVSEDLSDTRGLPKLNVWDEQRVLVAALEWLNGHLGGQKLHEMLGEESPGERHLARMCRRLVEQFEAVGYLEREDNGSRWIAKKRGRGYYLKPLTDKPDEMATPETEAETVGIIVGTSENIAAD